MGERTSARYVRTRNGGMVHLSECRYASGGVPWKWAERGLPGTVELRRWLASEGVFLGVRACRHCLGRGRGPGDG